MTSQAPETSKPRSATKAWRKLRAAYGQAYSGSRQAAGTASRLAKSAGLEITALARKEHTTPPPPRGLFYVAHIALALLQRIEQRSIFVLPGGVAFFFLLGILPATAAIASFYGLLANPGELVQLSPALATALPSPVAHLIQEALSRVAEGDASSLGISAAVSLFMTLMSANWGTKAFCEALNIVFDRRETRNYFAFTGVTLLMTTLSAVVVGVYFWVTYHVTRGGLPHYTSPILATLAEGLSIWLLLSLLIGTLYRLGPAPSPRRPPVPLLSGGAVMAGASVMVVSWILARELTQSATFVRNFGELASLSAIVIWTWIIVVLILIGAEVVEITEEEKREDRIRRSSRWPLLHLTRRR